MNARPSMDAHDTNFYKILAKFLLNLESIAAVFSIVYGKIQPFAELQKSQFQMTQKKTKLTLSAAPKSHTKPLAKVSFD